MKYSVTVPVITMLLDRQNPSETLKALKCARADRVLLVAYRSFSQDKFREQNINSIRKYDRFFKENGFDTAIWVAPVFGYGGGQGGGETDDSFMQIKSLRAEQIAPSVYCPSDEKFTRAYAAYVGELSRLGVGTIVLDDDYCLACRGEIWGCACDNHIREYSRRIGREMTRSEICEKVLLCGENEYRKEWIRMQRDTMLDFARSMRASADPSVRLGICAGRTSWDIECADSLEIARVLAGDHRPVIRLSGAPYWQDSLGSVVETARIQCHWMKDEDVELLTEGDTYPRPRYATPASALEGFDLALRCDGNADGILRYMLDYNSSAKFETGYIEHYLENRALYRVAERHFSDKRAAGVHLFEPQRVFPVQTFDEGQIYQNRFMHRNALPTAAQQFAADNALAVTYEPQGGAHIVFDDRARLLPEEMFGEGLYLDMKAARILAERGVDVGLEGAEVSARPDAEYFEDDREYVAVNCDGKFYEAGLKSGAVVRSWFLAGEKRFPAVYRYENAKGERFCVLCADADQSRQYSKYTAGLFRSYCRARQVQSDLEWAGRKPLVAKASGQPDLYLLVKEDETSVSVGVFNFFQDAWLSPKIELGESYASAAFYNCSGRLKGKSVLLDKKIESYGFAAIVLKKRGKR